MAQDTQEIRSKLPSVEQDYSLLRRELDAVYASRSWRLTRPIRAMRLGQLRPVITSLRWIVRLVARLRTKLTRLPTRANTWSADKPLALDSSAMGQMTQVQQAAVSDFGRAQLFVGRI